MSSGGICAFSVAWEHPEAFSKVVSHCGSFLQGGARDLDLIFGSWPVANHDVAAALAYREYDYKFQ